ncbi:MAG TPA: hypothetical protein VHX38_11655 [Pseudonocardiaceae bacterium]|jgi:hypothetical protein|nr:hypothetical protein [Pseudonocardiaceae bacterium]
MIFVRAFEPDETYDRTYASNGESRYGAYLAQYAHLFTDGHGLTEDAQHFAAAAWQITQEPTMTPAYVHTHGRVQAATVNWDDEERPAICVDLAVSSPPEAACLRHPWRRWTRDEHGSWTLPGDYRHRNAVTLLRLAVPLAEVPLPYAAYQDDQPHTDTAKQAVRAICTTLNAALVHVLAFDPLTGDTP